MLAQEGGRGACRDGSLRPGCAPLQAVLQHFAATPAMQALPEDAQWNIRQLLARSAAPVAAVAGVPSEGSISV